MTHTRVYRRGTRLWSWEVWDAQGRPIASGTANTSREATLAAARSARAHERDPYPFAELDVTAEEESAWRDFDARR